MKLSCFPYLIQKEILDHLSINHLFFLSLCSKSTKNFIKQVQKYQLEKVERIIYDIKSAPMYINYKMADMGLGYPVMRLYKSKTNLQERMKSDWVEEVRVNELGIPIDFLRSHTTKYSRYKDYNLHVKYCPDTLESILESIHSQLCDLFGEHTKFWLNRDSYFRDSEEEDHLLPMFQNIQKLTVLSGRFESTKLDEFLDRSTCLEQFTWGTALDKPVEVRENSKLYEIDTVCVFSYVSNVYSLTVDVLKRFNGRRAFLHDNSFAGAGVIQFFNEWKSGEKYKNLELISLDYARRFGNIRDSLEFKEVGTEVKYTFVPFEVPGFSLDFVDTGEFKSRCYMVRESDGRVASVMLTEYLAVMGVWDMTEKEFLAKFDSNNG